MYLQGEQNLLWSMSNNKQKELQAKNMEDSNLFLKGNCQENSSTWFTKGYVWKTQTFQLIIGRIKSFLRGSEVSFFQHIC